jgi:CheY-like chemotaxis protein
MTGQTHTQEGASRVLVVEDTPDIRDVLCEILMFEGYDVVTAEDGAQALARVLERHFDVILTDLMMPVMTGLELLERLADRPEHPPVVAMSAFERYREEATRQGAVAFLSKPVDIDVLLREVQLAITNGHPH